MNKMIKTIKDNRKNNPIIIYADNSYYGTSSVWNQHIKSKRTIHLNKREKTNVCAEITISNTYAIKIL